LGQLQLRFQQACANCLLEDGRARGGGRREPYQGNIFLILWNKRGVHHPFLIIRLDSNDSFNYFYLCAGELLLPRILSNGYE
jgi:hypothetical protein